MVKNTARKLAAGLLLGAIALGAQAHVADKKVLTLDGARKVIAAAARPMIGRSDAGRECRN